jgi:hypothetical protein
VNSKEIWYREVRFEETKQYGKVSGVSGDVDRARENIRENNKILATEATSVELDAAWTIYECLKYLGQKEAS